MNESLQSYKCIQTPTFTEERGALSVCETLDFEPRRYFVVYDVPKGEVRGNHAHRSQAEFIICTNGRCRVTVDNGVKKESFLLDTPSKGVLVPPMTWTTQEYLDRDTTLFVLASEEYKPAGYFYDYGEFIKAVVGDRV